MTHAGTGDVKLIHRELPVLLEAPASVNVKTVLDVQLIIYILI